MVNIAIIGYGRMGHEIENTAKEMGVKVISTIDSSNKDATYKEINEKSLKDVDVAIDFTAPDAVFANVRKITDMGINVVLGTTGWYERKEELEEIVKENNTGLIWSGNFSMGVNMFFKIVEAAAKIVDKIDDYDILVQDIHHNQKLDSPSGTALMTASILLENIERKTEIVGGNFQGKIQPEQLQISSASVGFVNGIHTVTIDSPADTIKIEHTARNRTGFAKGAINAALFIHKKKGFYNIDDLMKSYLEEN